MDTLPDGSVTSPRGFRAGGVAAGIKESGALDLAALVSDSPAVVAGTFSRNQAAAASVISNRRRILRRQGRGVLVNSGNANCATGAQGMADNDELAHLLAVRLGVADDDVFPCSTGVIGVPLPMDKVRRGAAALTLTVDGGHDFARAIMTTDTTPKAIAVQATIAGRTITMGGVAKGAGMIHPNMATMLAFITTDAPVAPDWLQDTLRAVVNDTFNMIDIDNDESTNDTVLVFANGQAGGPVIDGGPAGDLLRTMLYTVCERLATSIVRDGEGATKLIEVLATGAATADDARKIARGIAASLMVKTAVHGNDPNWGRILGAAGNQGVPLDLDRIAIAVGDIPVFVRGAPTPYDRAAAVAALDQPSVRLCIDLGVGDQRARAWGCNLSEEYVTLNSVYTT